MKQLTATITTGLFMLLPIACTQEYGQEQADNHDITVGFTATAGELAARAEAAVGKSLEAGANVTVHAWTSALSSATSENPALSNTYTVDNSGETVVLKATGGPMQVQTGLSYYFYALSTNSATDAVPALSGSYQTSTLHNGVDYLMATANITNSGGDSEITVPLSFRHLAAQIVLTVKPATTDGYLSADALSVSIADTDPTGSYIDLSVGSDSPALITGGVPGDLPSGQTKGATVSQSSPAEFTVSFIVLPVTASARGIPLKLDFTNLSFESDKTTASKSYTASILPETGKTLTLEGGYSYAYEVRIARYAASFSLPTVKPWELFGVDMDKIELDPK
ncbi:MULTISPECIES: fimbrillin family protein [Parabacteroides]|uniref:Fimbrillin family protein n=7 Tax=Parabacteroides goldsteinii TaxID=328812 RepID=A0A6G1ZIZ9_9BACT|nr:MULTISPECIES: fimbrillin family protein [Parabacteroides]EOS19627.1 hypothetical protein C803_00306 [Parabacteroides goldsteinii dnLKV18]KAI4360629.1 hypothetical protein C825_002686 [Parabacteroides sp. ASF519]MBF0767455.1 fimbrillin family protein [Parabacteroides goldsteinii]MDZ3929204.1 fimbrillin family protein [Parabacteroides goldsteinii]MRX93832.1 hypothetical protein [Parabacteroides goldsteinii]